MAERRMFSKSVLISDNFLDMSLNAQYLYFMFGIYADDDGFVGSPKTIMRQCGIKNTAFSELIQNNYIIRFDTGVIAIRHWKLNNYIQKDRYKKTIYINEFNSLTEENNIYVLQDKNGCIQNVSKTDTQVSIDKVSIDKDSLLSVPDEPETKKETKHKYGKYKNVLLSDNDIKMLKEKYPYDYTAKIENLSEGIELKGYKYKNHYLAIIKWAENAKEKLNNTENSYAGYDLELFEKMLDEDI